MLRRPLIVAVWKEKLTYAESVATAREVAQGVRERDLLLEVGIAPNPFSYVGVAGAVDGAGIRLVAQNVLWGAAEGSFIGEVTGRMLQEVGCDYVIVGHSERRRFFAEDDDTVMRKALAAVAAGAQPIVCIGDNEAERKAGLTAVVLERQLRPILEHLADHAASGQVLVAYEPVWAISTWRTEDPLPSGDEISKMHSDIRRIVSRLAGRDTANAVPILFGGSVSSLNGADYFRYEEIAGALVGGASKSASSFLATLDSVAEGLVART